MADERPPIWIGHVSMNTNAFEELLAFFVALGMRQVATMDDLAVLELRGGTHLVLRRAEDAEGTQAAFDLMVDDIEAQHAALKDAGHAPGAIERGKIYARFEVAEPGGNTITFFDSHVAGPV